MAEFPSSPITPSEFFESWFPKAFAEAELPPGSADVEVKLGMLLHGDGGGEWIFDLDRGSLSVAQASREDAALTVVQSVDDWRGALWEGRGGAFGEQAMSAFKPGIQPVSGPAAGGMTPAALAQLRNLDGMIRMVVAGGEGGDWQVSLRLGPGAIPAEPNTTVTVSAADAQAMADGSLDPMQAFMSGRIQVAGDMALMMQMQAVSMQAMAAAAQKSS